MVSAMAAATVWCQRQWTTVSLYVNDYNTRARAMYARCGYEQVNEFATVLF